MDEVVLRRKVAAAGWWTLLGTAAIAAGVFFVVDSHGHPVAWVLAVLFSVPTVYFLLQLLWPGSVEVRLDRDGLRSRSPLGRRSVAWEDVHVAKVRRILGDPFLVVDVRRSDGDLDRTRIPLPVGADLDRLHVFLRERLGRGSRLPSPGSLRPLDL